MHRHKLSYVHSPSMICLYTLYHYMFIRCQNVAARRSVAIVLSTNIANCRRRPSTTAMPACPPSRISADNCPIYSRSEIAAPVGGDVGAIPTSSLYKLCCCAATQKNSRHKRAAAAAAAVDARARSTGLALFAPSTILRRRRMSSVRGVAVSGLTDFSITTLPIGRRLLRASERVNLASRRPEKRAAAT